MDVFPFKVLLLMFPFSAEVVEAQQPEQFYGVFFSSLKDDCFCSWETHKDDESTSGIADI